VQDSRDARRSRRRTVDGSQPLGGARDAEDVTKPPLRQARSNGGAEPDELQAAAGDSRTCFCFLAKAETQSRLAFSASSRD